MKGHLHYIQGAIRGLNVLVKRIVNVEIEKEKEQVGKDNPKIPGLIATEDARPRSEEER